MLQKIFRVILGVVAAIALVLNSPGAAYAQGNLHVNSAELGKAVQEIEALDGLRSGLAATLEGQSEEPTIQTMKEVCKPVGRRAMEISQENHWQVKQIASKYRNPSHAPDNLHAVQALARFEQDKDLIGFWDRETIDRQEGTRYYRRINVEQSCLACHGLQNNRPQFVKDNYPQDRAYDFNVGDLRGMYAVFIPDVQETLQQSLEK